MQPIAEFSELGDFLNMPVRYYSAGMMVRLAFSIATAIEPEILIIDEVLSAGDMAFQAKARERMKTLMSNAAHVIVVSHDLACSLLCERSIWLDHGKMQHIGPTEEVIAAYTQQVIRRRPAKQGGVTFKIILHPSTEKGAGMIGWRHWLAPPGGIREALGRKIVQGGLHRTRRAVRIACQRVLRAAQVSFPPVFFLIVLSKGDGGGWRD